MADDVPVTELCGELTMEVVASKDSPEAAARWSGRVEALAAWLLAEWEGEGRDAGESPRYSVDSRAGGR